MAKIREIIYGLPGSENKLPAKGHETGEGFEPMKLKQLLTDKRVRLVFDDGTIADIGMGSVGLPPATRSLLLRVALGNHCS